MRAPDEALLRLSRAAGSDSSSYSTTAHSSALRCRCYRPAGSKPRNEQTRPRASTEEDAWPPSTVEQIAISMFSGSADMRHDTTDRCYPKCQ